MNDIISRKAVLTMIGRVINSLEPHGHPAMGDDEVRIEMASRIAKMVSEMNTVSERETPVISRLSHGPAGTLVDMDGNVICTFNLQGKMTVQQAFAYAEAFIDSVNRI